MGTEKRKKGPSANQRVVDTLYRVANFMGEVTDLHRLLTIIMEESENVMDSEASACMLYDEESDELYFEVVLGEKAEEVKSIRLKRGEGFGGICLAEGKTLIVNDVRTDPRHAKKADEQAEFVTRNLIATPMTYRGRVIGVLEVLNKRNEAPYNDGDAKILEILADQAAIAIVNARLVEESIERERLAAIGMAVSGIAHHLRNIIQSIKGSVALMKMGTESDDSNLITSAMPILARAGERMEQSVKEMLTFSKEREPELEWGSLNDLAAEIVEESRSQAQEKNVALVADLDEALTESFIDKFRLHDAMLNLVGNAIDAQPRDAKDGRVTIRTRLETGGGGDRQTLEVEDNGTGMPEDVLKEIFKPFFSTKGSKGTGLGLAVARKVAEESGGTLAVESTVGEGTTFFLRLPVVKRNPCDSG